MDESRDNPSKTAVEEWVRGTTGTFSLTNIYNEMRILAPESKAYLRVIMRRFVDDKILVALGKKDGLYRLVDNEAPEQYWQSANKMSVPLRFPFELEKLVRILPKSLIILAGSAGAGKTAMLYNIVVMNMYDFDLHLFNSEMGDSQIKERFNAIDSTIPNPAPFHIRSRQENFEDVIEADKINLIDYLDFDEDPWMIGSKLRKILQKLNDGVAIIAIQKPIGRDLGYGAGYSLKSASLYLSMDAGKLKIVKARERAISDVDPLGKTWGFRLDNRGANFIDISEEVRKSG